MSRFDQRRHNRDSALMNLSIQTYRQPSGAEAAPRKPCCPRVESRSRSWRGGAPRSRCTRASWPGCCRAYVYSNCFSNCCLMLGKLERPVHGCIESDVCTQILMFKHFRDLQDIQTFAPLRIQNSAEFHQTIWNVCSNCLSKLMSKCHVCFAIVVQNSPIKYFDVFW